jgi:hypothetical protein
VRQDFHEPFAFQLHEGFAQRDAADPELGGQRVLAKLVAVDVLAGQDATAQFVRGGLARVA